MKTEDVIAIFEHLNKDGNIDIDLADTCTGFAEWLAKVWNHLGSDDISLLTGVGAVLWREGFARQR
ncbi:hypothetical protein CY652_07020 [Burkholderia sp. WAC0059]|uniref:hypothetical protein n=1 Tax=Burkholderia sp. WAC0059 TaxID=2066022 RepID=UPI000C7F3304|nr:hypothetical protein [Burkholderia sp. WAC0059]PLZ03055.1 hypothetical protein CY652_07020 [Burkholderia sp. WAC0059]